MQSRVLVVAADCATVLGGAEMVDAVVTDPPYDLGFMGQEWDRRQVAFRPETWAAVLSVMRSGAYLAAFGATRTYHRMACAIEDAGFEIHDSLQWLYGMGFPKHRSKLKPAVEPIVLARKPARLATALNIDDCRIPFLSAADEAESKAKNRHGDFGTLHGGNNVYGDYSTGGTRDNYAAPGRWPANVVLDEAAAEILDVDVGDLPAGNRPRVRNTAGTFRSRAQGETGSAARMDAGGPSRFFYVAKASRAERDLGLAGGDLFQPQTFEPQVMAVSGGAQGAHNRGETYGVASTIGLNAPKAVRNAHPTVKPVALMRWLVRLITPAAGVVLDPFAGSGTTGVACLLERRSCVLVEQDPAWASVARARCMAVNSRAV